MTEPDDVSPAQLLERWLQAGLLASQYDAFVAQSRSGHGSPYENVVRLCGWKAVEAELNARCASDFAASIEVVARGMLALANADTTGRFVQLGAADVEEAAFSLPRNLSDCSKMIVMSNEPPVLIDSTFAPGGQVGLKAVTLRVGRDRTHGNPAAQLCIVLPKWRYDLAADGCAYTVLSVELSGFTTATVCTSVLSKETRLKRALGLSESPDQVVSYERSETIDGIDRLVGHPGVLIVWAKLLPQLGGYFSALAGRLTTGR